MRQTFKKLKNNIPRNTSLSKKMVVEITIKKDEEKKSQLCEKQITASSLP